MTVQELIFLVLVKIRSSSKKGLTAPRILQQTSSKREKTPTV